MDMARQHRERASKTKAVENIAAMLARPLPTFGDSGAETIWLRFPKDIWNETPPATHEAKISPPKQKAAPKRRRKAAFITTEDDATTKASKRSLLQPRQCKVKVSRFHYGGPDARVAGRYKNDITLDAPCHQPTCANCWKWHAQSIRSPVTRTDPNNEHLPSSPEASPLSPAIDPRILDDTWQMFPSRRNSTTNTHEQNPAPHASITPPKPSHYTIFLPTSLLTHKAPPASRTTRWRTSPQQRYTACLSFPTPIGRARFRALVHELARREMREESKRLGGTTRRIVRGALGMGGDGVERRRRHRVRLVFTSQVGRERYRGLVGGFL